VLSVEGMSNQLMPFKSARRADNNNFPGIRAVVALCGIHAHGVRPETFITRSRTQSARIR